MARDDAQTLDGSGTPRVLPAAWLEELRAIVGSAWVATGPEELAWAGGDAAGAYRLGVRRRLAAVPLAVVRPAGTEETAAVVSWAARHGVPLVPRGAGTGVMGGAVPLRPALVVDLSRLDDVVVLAEDQLVEAGAGAVLADVDAALRPHGLCLGHDPWSLALATVGGAIGTDGMGYTAGRWGSMGDQVAAVEAVLADGTVVRTRPVKPAVGPRLHTLFAGSQGTLGLVTRAWLRAVPLPEAERFWSFRFRGFDQAYAALLALWRTGLRYDLLDLSDGPPQQLDLPPGWEDRDGRTAVLHLGAFGPEKEADARLSVARDVLGGAGAVDLGPEPARNFWRRRHALAERYAREVQARRDAAAREAFTTGLDYLNVALPPSRVCAYRRQALARVAREPGFAAGETGIWCRPEVFSLVIYRTEPEGTDPAAHQRLMDDLLRLAVEHGGSVECIHGTGIKLLHLVDEELGSAGHLLRVLKAALDPQELLNPGKVPTLGPTRASCPPMIPAEGRAHRAGHQPPRADSST